LKECRLRGHLQRLDGGDDAVTLRKVGVAKLLAVEPFFDLGQGLSRPL